MRLLRMHANEREPIESARSRATSSRSWGSRRRRPATRSATARRRSCSRRCTSPSPSCRCASSRKTNADRDRLNEALARLAREDPTFRTHVVADTGRDDHRGHGGAAPRGADEPPRPRPRRRRERRQAPRRLPPDRSRGRGEGEAVFERQIASKIARGDGVARRRGRRRAPATVAFANAAPAASSARRPCVAARRARGPRSAAQGSAGFAWPALDLRVTLLGGSTARARAPVRDRLRGRGGRRLREGVRGGGPVLLEPAMRLEVHDPERVHGGDPRRPEPPARRRPTRARSPGDLRILIGRAPLSAMFGYSTTVRSLSQGRAGLQHGAGRLRAGPRRRRPGPVDVSRCS